MLDVRHKLSSSERHTDTPAQAHRQPRRQQDRETHRQTRNHHTVTEEEDNFSQEFTHMSSEGGGGASLGGASSELLTQAEKKIERHKVDRHICTMEDRDKEEKRDARVGRRVKQVHAE